MLLSFCWLRAEGGELAAGPEGDLGLPVLSSEWSAHEDHGAIGGGTVLITEQEDRFLSGREVLRAQPHLSGLGLH